MLDKDRKCNRGGWSWCFIEKSVRQKNANNLERNAQLWVTTVPGYNRCHLPFYHLKHGQTLWKKFWKIPIRCKVKASFLKYCLESPHNYPHARVRHVILANARIEPHLKVQIGCFGYCRIPLNTEKVIVFPIFFCKCGGLTRLWRNLPIWVKVAWFSPFFDYDDKK